jgi:glycosyltransferase involved in cell wall biosynthesis
MYSNHRITVVIPCYNEASQIGNVVHTLPAFVDDIVIIDDRSTDNTVEVVRDLAANDGRIHLIEHEKNQGNGGARVSGLKYCRDSGTATDIICLMDGDGQMNPDDLTNLLDPIVSGHADYTKGNRFFSGVAWERMPTIRYMGNATLSLMTKIASGYWQVADSQTGFIAFRARILKLINLDHLYKDYGFPNDLLIHVNLTGSRVKDIPIDPLYNVGEKSVMKIWKTIPRISWLLTRRFFWRMKQQYIIRDFHPLVFFYLLGILLFILAFPFAIRMIYVWINTGRIPPMNALALIFLMVSSMQSVFFAMWFDMDYNRNRD